MKTQYSFISLNDWLSEISAQLNTSLHDESQKLPDYFGNGVAHMGNLEEGFSYRLVDYKLHSDLDKTYETSKEFCLIINFYTFISSNNIHLEIGNHVIENEGGLFKLSSMNSSDTPVKRKLKKGTHIKGVSIQLSEEWLIKNIKSTKYYERLRNSTAIVQVLTDKQQKILNEIFESYRSCFLPSLFLTIRLMSLLEGLFNQFFSEKPYQPKLSLSARDIEGITSVETELLENYTEPFPKIKKLARIAGMSESKLKKMYKKAFGMGMFEHYQKNRMQKAKELLDSGKYSVSEVGNLLGYANLSNFSTSFKKEFDLLPKKYHVIPN